jgi:hypothetical protein
MAEEGGRGLWERNESDGADRLEGKAKRVDLALSAAEASGACVAAADADSDLHSRFIGEP